MTDDVLASLGKQRLQGAKGRHQHHYDRVNPAGRFLVCRCGKEQDIGQTRKARSSVRLGKDTERRIERIYGPLKVGERGDAIDLLGRDFRWQSKATRSPMPAYLAAVTTWEAIEPRAWMTRPFDAMEPLHRELRPLLIRSFVRPGVPTRDVIVARSCDWAELHGGPAPMTELMIMTGTYFLDINGRDERQEGKP